MKLLHFKTLISSLAIITMISGCAQKTGNQTYDNNQNAIIGTTIGALAGIVLGNNIGGGNKGRNQVIGAVAGAAVGGWNGPRRGACRVQGGASHGELPAVQHGGGRQELRP